LAPHPAVGALTWLAVNAPFGSDDAIVWFSASTDVERVSVPMNFGQYPVWDLVSATRRPTSS
jgi:hypothetical protein